MGVGKGRGRQDTWSRKQQRLVVVGPEQRSDLQRGGLPMFGSKGYKTCPYSMCEAAAVGGLVRVRCGS